MANKIFIPFKGFTPSVDPSVPGAILNCSNMVPTLRGMKSAPSPTPFGNPAFPAPVTGAAACELLNGTYRTFAGTATNLYEVVNNTNNVVSAVANGYTGGSNPWRFAQFGNASLASNGQDPIQQSISSGNFAPISGAPAAAIIEVTQGFVFAFNTTDGVNGARPHGWWCSGLYDQTQWTPSQSTQCANGIIIDQPGAITAGKALGTNIIAYKLGSMFYGVYQGPPVIWGFNQISPQIGTPCQECVVSVTAAHYFLGTDKQVYYFDGTIPQPIGDEVHEWLAANWSTLHQQNVQSFYDEANSLIYWYFASVNGTGSIDTCLVYNHRTGKFGRADLKIEAAVQAISGQITWQGMGALPGVTTWNTLPAIAYNSSYWTQFVPNQGVIDSTNTMQSLTGASATSSITTGWLGDDYSYTDYLGFIPRFSQQPATCTGVANTKHQLGLQQNPTQWTIGPWYDGELVADFSDRYCQVQLSFTGNHEILGMSPRIAPSGEI